MKDRTASVISGIACVLLVIALLLACVFAFAFDADFYKDEYAKLGSAQYVGVSEEDLFGATDTLLDYLEGGRDNLDYKTEQGDEFFNQKEKLHMADVKNLYNMALGIAWSFFLVGAALLAVIFAKKRKNAVLPVLKGYNTAGAIVLGFFAFVAVYAAVDFNTFWVNFHLMFFTNDLWMLDPATDRLIRMYETQFFFDLVFYILVLFLSIFIGTFAAAKIYLRSKKRKLR